MNEWLDIANGVESSYKKNDLGWVLYGLVRMRRPLVCVELGVLHGYSTLFIAAALRDNGMGHLFAYDRWPGHKPNIHLEVPQFIEQAGLGQWITLETRDVMVDSPKHFNIGLLHVDLNNMAEVVSWAMSQYGGKLAPNGLMVFEGGSHERDQEEWVARHGHPMRDVLDNEEAMRGWQQVTFPWFPSMTMIERVKE